MANFNVEGVVRLTDQFSATASKITAASEKMSRGMEVLKTRAKQLAGVLSLAFIGNKLKHGFLEGAAEEKLVRRFDHFFTAVQSKVGMTKDVLMKEIEDLKSLSGFDVEDIMGNVTAPLLRSGKVTGANLLRAQQLAANIAAMNGNDGAALQEAGSRIAQAMSNPMRAMRMVREFMSPEEFEKLKQSMKGLKSSDVAGLQDQILKALESKYKSGAASMADSMSTTLLRLNGAVGDINSGIGNLINSALGDELRSWASDAQELASKFSNIGLELKKIQGFGGKLDYLFDAFMTAPPAIRATTVAIMGLGAAIGGAILAAMGPVGWAILGITAAVATIAYYWDPIKAGIQGVATEMTRLWQSFAMTESGVTAINLLKAAFQGLQSYIGFLVDYWVGAFEKVLAVVNKVSSTLSSVGSVIGQTFSAMNSPQFEGGDAEADFYVNQGKIPAAPGIQGVPQLGAKAEAKVDGQVNITINDKTGAATVNSTSAGNVPVNVGKTAGGAYSSNGRRLPAGR